MFKKKAKTKLKATVEKGITFNLPLSTELVLKGARCGGENQPLIEYGGAGVSVVPILKGDGKKVIAIAGKTTLKDVIKFHKTDEFRVFVDTGVIAKKN